MERCLGQWCAYVIAGKTTEERDKRFEEVPEQFKIAVMRHRQTVYSIRKFHQNNRVSDGETD